MCVSCIAAMCISFLSGISVMVSFESWVVSASGFRETMLIGLVPCCAFSISFLFPWVFSVFLVCHLLISFWYNWLIVCFGFLYRVFFCACVDFLFFL